MQARTVWPIPGWGLRGSSGAVIIKENAPPVARHGRLQWTDLADCDSLALSKPSPLPERPLVPGATAVSVAEGFRILLPLQSSLSGS